MLSKKARDTTPGMIGSTGEYRCVVANVSVASCSAFSRFDVIETSPK